MTEVIAVKFRCDDNCTAEAVSSSENILPDGWTWGHNGYREWHCCPAHAGLTPHLDDEDPSSAQEVEAHA